MITKKGSRHPSHRAQKNKNNQCSKKPSTSRSYYNSTRQSPKSRKAPIRQSANSRKTTTRQSPKSRKTDVRPSTARHKTSRSRRNPARLIALISIVVVVCSVAVATFCAFYYEPKTVAERELEKLATAYYEDYFYEKNAGDDPASLAKYAETGFATVYLRHLLNFDHQRFASSASAFNNASYACDTNETGIKIFPKSPYGPTDYEITYNYSCEYL